MIALLVLLVIFYCDIISTKPTFNEIPPIKHTGFFEPDYNSDFISARISSWSPLEEGNVWELSGLSEGDIMKDPEYLRNAELNDNSLWNNATIPYLIDLTFSPRERKIIREGLNMIENNSCFKFRPFKFGDLDFVLVQGRPNGCWSYVGRKRGGQVLNLQHFSGCINKTVVAHEFLHAAGFYHQQSAHNRDEYIFVNFTNIQPGQEHNFEKLNDSVVTDYGVGYDYISIMHYSRKAFSKNGEDTMVPLKEDVNFGNEDLSEKDIAKLKLRYGCDHEKGSKSLKFI